MKRIALGLTVVALTVTACQDAQQPTASFQLADGRNWTVESDWNSHFFFLAPLAETPSSFPGMFDPTAGDYLRAWVTGPWPVNMAISPPDIAGSCQGDPVAGDAFPYELPKPVLSTAGQSYATSWHPSKDTGVQPTEDNSLAYRICVSYDAAGQEIILGWRDVLPDDGGSDQPRNTAQNPLYQFGANSNLPVKFRVEEGILDAEFCVNGDITNADAYDCTAQILASNETATCQNETCQLTAGGLPAMELFVVEKFGPDDAECTNPGQTGWLNVDIPQYAGCVRITVPNGEFDGFLADFGTGYGTVGACFYAESGPPLKLGTGIDQDESVQMHIQYPEVKTSNLDPDETMPTVWALPWGNVTTQVFATCEGIFDEGPQQDEDLAWLAPAKRLWDYAKSLVTPQRAFAFHTGFGGHTTLKSTEPSLSSDEGMLAPSSALRADDGAAEVVAYSGPMQNQAGEKVYQLAWALPSAMKPAGFSSGSQVANLPASPIPTLYVSQGENVDVSVLVEDNGALYGTGRTLGTPRAVEGAKVHFLVDGIAQPQQPDTTGSEGLASFTWPAAGSGLHTISAQGFGIGTDAGPFDAFDGPNYVNQATPLAYGRLDFPVYVCDASLTPNLVDGKVNSGEYPDLNKVDFTAKVSGGAAAATLYWAYDCSNLYFALEVAADDELANEIVLVFDNNNDGKAELGDDVWSLLRNTKTGAFTIADKYLTSRCLGSKQATCGDLDTSDGGDDNLSGGKISYDEGKKVTVYEIAHPLTGDVKHDIQIDLAKGTTIGVYIVLQMGSGAQGNTQFPGFRSYLPIAIGPLK